MGARFYAAGARVYASLVILVSAQVLSVLTLGLWTRTSELGLTMSNVESSRKTVDAASVYPLPVCMSNAG